MCVLCEQWQYYCILLLYYYYVYANYSHVTDIQCHPGSYSTIVSIIVWKPDDDGGGWREVCEGVSLGIL